MSEPTLTHRTARGLAWAGLETAARALLQFGVLAILARLLTPADYGVMGAATVVIGISTIFAQLGVGPAVVQRKELQAEHLDTAFYASLVFGLLTTLLVYLTAPALAALFRLPELAGILRWLSIVFLFTSAGVVPESLLTRELRFDVLARIEVTSYLFSYAVVGVGAAFLGMGVWSLVAAQSTQALMRNVQLFRRHTWRPVGPFRSAAFRDLLHFSGGTTLARLANYAATSGDNLVVGRALGADALGSYGRAYQIMAAPAVLLGNTLEKVLFPALAKVQDRPDQLGRVFHQGIAVLCTIMVPCTVCLYLLAPEIVALLLGPKWTGVVVPLQLFATGVLLRTSMKISNSIIRARGAVFGMVACQVLFAATTIGFAWVGTRWGVEGACLGVFASIALCSITTSGLTLALLGAKWIDFLKAHLPGLGLGAVTYLATAFIADVLRASHVPAFVVCAVTGAVVLVIMGVVCALFPRTFLGFYGERMAGLLRKSLASRRKAPLDSNIPAAERSK